MKTKVYIPIPVSSGELPEITAKEYFIIDDDHCKYSAMFIDGNFWTNDMKLNILFWLKETIIDIPDELSDKEIEIEAEKLYDEMNEFLNYEFDGLSAKANYKQGYFNGYKRTKSLSTIYPNDTVVGEG